MSALPDTTALAPADLLKSVFGFDKFRPGQAEIIEAIMEGKEALAIMPTGGGKSLCFQIPALCREGLTLVISPLIALMRDQVNSLRAAGVEAGALTSANDPEENERVFSAIDDKRLKLLYIAPERLNSALPLLRRIGVTFIAVDEAHCVSQWGHDFRPDYLKIGNIRRELGMPQIAGFTATADAETRTEICSKLFEDEPALFLQGFDRPNIHLAFASKDSPRKQLLNFASARAGRSGVIYASSRNKTEVLAKALSDAGIPALPYHAGLDAETRQIHQDRFQREDGLVICATIAFGMGVDKPDIRYVLHADLPKTMEGYYQEIGRAGRDGAPAEAMTLYGLDDIRLRRMQIDESPAPQERKSADHQRLNALLSLAEAPRCRRQTLLAYFGDELPEPCGSCDLCDTPPQLFDGTEAVRKALSAVYRTEERYGVEHLITVLRGEVNEKSSRAGHDQLSVFGLGADKSKNWWRSVFRQMYALGLTWIDSERYNAWRLAECARPVLRGEESIQLRADALRTASSTRKDKRAPAALLAEEDEPLFTALKAKRRELAEAQKVPAFVVFADRTLLDMATKRPQNLDELTNCYGVGGKKLQRYGAAFLEVLTGETPTKEAHPARVKVAASGDGALFDALHQAQLDLARGTDGAQKFMTCNRATLAQIAATRPHDQAGLSQIQGMNEQKLDRFGAAFLSIIASQAG
ncbi:MAG: DNA helicase RecQ [Pikeienuella sp.]